MKYKKQLATGALALSLLVSGSTIYATSPQDFGLKNTSKTYQRDTNPKAVRLKKKDTIVGTVSALTSTGFTLNITNMKTKTTSSLDVVTDTATLYRKDGLPATATDVLVGQKVIVTGTFDKTTNILTAKTVKIITKVVTPKAKKEIKKEVNTTTKTN